MCKNFMKGKESELLLDELSKFIRKAYINLFLEIKFDLYYFHSQNTVKTNLDILCSLVLLM